MIAAVTVHRLHRVRFYLTGNPDRYYTAYAAAPDCERAKDKIRRAVKAKGHRISSWHSVTANA